MGKAREAGCGGVTALGLAPLIGTISRFTKQPAMRAPTMEDRCMCRSIKTLHNFEPPATEEEIRASAVQFVRKLSGFARPSQINRPAFDRAVDQVTAAARDLLASLVTSAPPRNREDEAVKARVRSANRFPPG
jgi:hypothetical protein